MSGRPKRTEAEDLREVIREAHAAIKDLRLALRDVRAAQAEGRQALAEGRQALADDLARATAAGIAELRDAANEYIEHLQGQWNNVLEHVTGLLGAGTPQELTDEIVRNVAADLARQLRIDLEADGGPEIVPRQPQRVFVTTDPAMAAPGSLVIDVR
jgi:Sec-independent protein translocase protein TatA